MVLLISNCPMPSHFPYTSFTHPHFLTKKKMSWDYYYILFPSSASEDNMLIRSKMTKGQEYSRRIITTYANSQM